MSPNCLSRMYSQIGSHKLEVQLRPSSHRLNAIPLPHLPPEVVAPSLSRSLCGEYKLSRPRCTGWRGRTSRRLRDREQPPAISQVGAREDPVAGRVPGLEGRGTPLVCAPSSRPCETRLQTSARNSSRTRDCWLRFRLRHRVTTYRWKNARGGVVPQISESVAVPISTRGVS